MSENVKNAAEFGMRETMRLTLEFYDNQFHIKNEGRVIASVFDKLEAMTLFKHMLEAVHTCPACEDGSEVDTIRKENYNNLQDVISEFRKMYVEEPHTR